MTRRVALLVLALLCTPVLYAAQAADLTGKWTGAFNITIDGQEQPDTAVMNLTQKGTALTGTVGPNEDRQWPILDGKVDGTKVTFMVQSEGPLVKFTLAFADGRLKGDAQAEEGGMTMSAKVDVGRAK